MKASAITTDRVLYDERGLSVALTRLGDSRAVQIATTRPSGAVRRITVHPKSLSDVIDALEDAERELCPEG